MPRVIYKNKDGKRIPGVTTVIGGQLGWNKEVLNRWANKEGLAGRELYKTLNHAADIGTLAHAMVEHHIKNTSYEELLKDYTQAQIDKAENGYLGFMEWEKAHNPVYVSSELKVVSEAYQFGGTLDGMCKFGDELTLLDLKTSKAVYVDHKIQLAAYREAYQEQTGEKISKCVVLQINKETGDFSYHSVDNETLDKCFVVFRHCRALYDLKKELGG